VLGLELVGLSPVNKKLKYATFQLLFGSLSYVYCPMKATKE